MRSVAWGVGWECSIRETQLLRNAAFSVAGTVLEVFYPFSVFLLHCAEWHTAFRQMARSSHTQLAPLALVTRRFAKQRARAVRQQRPRQRCAPPCHPRRWQRRQEQRQQLGRARPHPRQRRPAAEARSAVAAAARAASRLPLHPAAPRAHAPARNHVRAAGRPPQAEPASGTRGRGSAARGTRRPAAPRLRRGGGRPPAGVPHAARCCSG